MIALELLAGFIIDYDIHPAASEVYRNPTPKRYWPEYLRNNTGKNKKLVIIISNSQGVGPEIRNPGDIYISKIKNEFKNSNIPVVIENWSLGGIRTADIELLTAMAIKRGADLVLYVLYWRNIDYFQNINLDYPDSDINLIAGDLSLYKYYKNMIFFSASSLDDIAKRLIFLNSGLGRSRLELYDVVSLEFKRRYHKYLFGHVIKGASHSVDPLPGSSGKLPGLSEKYLSSFMKVRLRTDYFTKEEVDKRFISFRRFYSSIHRLLDGEGVNHVWVWQALSQELLKNVWVNTSAEEKNIILNNFNKFQNNSTSFIHELGGNVVDLTYALGNDSFYNFGHFNESGHSQMSSILFPIILNELQ